jgi:hypothetical protein
MRITLISLTATALAGLGAAEARAQLPYTPPPYTRPAVSPYINLLRRGSDPGVNYYGLVRPQQEFRSGIQQLQQQVGGAQAVGEQQAGGLPTTGHPVQFMNHLTYFQNLGSAAGQVGPARRPSAAPAAAAATPPPARGAPRR